MQTDRGSLTKIYWHFFHVWWEACGARLLAASGEGLYQMEICSLIDTSCYKPHWQRRWQSGETWVEALHGTEQKKTKNYRNGNENMKPPIILVKKETTQSRWIAEVSGSELLLVHLEKLQLQLFSVSPSMGERGYSQNTGGHCKQTELTHWKEPLTTPEFLHPPWKTPICTAFFCCCCFWVTIQISILQWKTSRATARHWLWQKQKAAASLWMIMSAWMLQWELSPGSLASS